MEDENTLLMGGEMATLKVFLPDGTAKTYTLKEGKNTIGRDETNDIVIDVPTVSGLHTTIEYKDSEYWIIDERSTNGTTVNGERIKPYREYKLKSGDEIYFGPEVKSEFVSEIRRRPTVKVTKKAEEEVTEEVEKGETVIVERGPRIRILTGKHAGEVYDLRKYHTIGRTEGAIKIEDDPTMSRLHAKFIFRDGMVQVVDAASSSGTFVNDEPITEPTTLYHKDRLTMGNTELEFLYEEAQPPEISPPVEGPSWISKNWAWLTGLVVGVVVVGVAIWTFSRGKWIGNFDTRIKQADAKVEEATMAGMPDNLRSYEEAFTILQQAEKLAKTSDQRTLVEAKLRTVGKYKDFWSYIIKSDSAFAESDYERAVTFADNACNLFGEETEEYRIAKERRDKAYVKLRFNEALRQAKSAYKQGEYETALIHIMTAEAYDANNEELKNFKIEVLFAQAQAWMQAIYGESSNRKRRELLNNVKSNCEEILKINPNHKDARDLAVKVEKMLAQMKPRSQKSPTTSSPISALATLIKNMRDAYDIGNLSEAEVYATEILRRSPGNILAGEYLNFVKLEREAIELEEKGDKEGAYQKWHALYNKVSYRSDKAAARAMEGMKRTKVVYNEDKARELYDEAITLWSRNPEGYSSDELRKIVCSKLQEALKYVPIGSTLHEEINNYRTNIVGCEE